ncbi:hypothetical protein FZ103_05250 [Streptomonospora sp. PA3]|uniref:hypothetical protein n=1 Tax=Streptomonospora sp. PA3 TaxID=2607326 RepID=UPI0012DE6B23|nr:hypothetical protein [Streptomonospora sp. PA3]MUL40591.1 hypothetical protein [Streptomonospora sp. PA3]
MAAMTVLCCVGFAAVNVVFAIGDRFAEGAYPEYAAGLEVMNWLVVVLKLLGAALVVLSVARPLRFPAPGAVAVALWAAFSTVAVYAAGNVAHVAAMATGLAGEAADIDAAGIAYVAFFLLMSAGLGTLALSHTRRHRIRPRTAVLGALGAPFILSGILAAAPALLTALGIMPPV